MTSFADKVPLGRTGLMVSRIGIGSSYGVSSRACRKAFDAGVNYFFWGSVRTRAMGFAIREIAETQRDDLVVVLQSYTRGRMTLRKSVDKGLRALRLDHADILLLGWHDKPPSPRLLESAHRLREQPPTRVTQSCSELLEREIARHTAAQVPGERSRPGLLQAAWPKHRSRVGWKATMRTLERSAARIARTLQAQRASLPCSSAWS